MFKFYESSGIPSEKLLRYAKKPDLSRRIKPSYPDNPFEKRRKSGLKKSILKAGKSMNKAENSSKGNQKRGKESEIQLQVSD